MHIDGNTILNIWSGLVRFHNAGKTRNPQKAFWCTCVGNTILDLKTKSLSVQISEKLHIFLQVKYIVESMGLHQQITMHLGIFTHLNRDLTFILSNRVICAYFMSPSSSTQTVLSYWNICRGHISFLLSNITTLTHLHNYKNTIAMRSPTPFSLVASSFIHKSQFASDAPFALTPRSCWRGAFARFGMRTNCLNPAHTMIRKLSKF